MKIECTHECDYANCNAHSKGWYVAQDRQYYYVVCLHTMHPVDGFYGAWWQDAGKYKTEQKAQQKADELNNN